MKEEDSRVRPINKSYMVSDKELQSSWLFHNTSTSRETNKSSLITREETVYPWILHGLVIQVVLVHCVLSVAGKQKCCSASRNLGKTFNYKSHPPDKERFCLF